MGFLDRLRKRAEGAGAPDGGIGAEVAGVLPTAGTQERPVVAASWPGLPQIQRAVVSGRAEVADARFGGRLPTWQNPSFTSTASPTVLDGRASATLGGDAPRTAVGRPVTGLERHAGALPLADPVSGVQRAPAVPLRVLPARKISGGGMGSASGALPARESGARRRGSASGSIPVVGGVPVPVGDGVPVPVTGGAAASPGPVQRAVASAGPVPLAPATVTPSVPVRTAADAPVGSPSPAAGPRVTPVGTGSASSRPPSLTRAQFPNAAVQRRTLPVAPRRTSTPPSDASQ